jgi:O-methyltransferase
VNVLGNLRIDDEVNKMLLRSKAVQRLAGGRLERWGTAVVSWMQLRFLGTHKDGDVLRSVKRMRKAVRGGPLANEAFLLYSLARSVSKMPGDYAEVGVFRGGSARMICEGKGDKRLHLFDTFCGLPDGSAKDEGAFCDHQYNGIRQNVEQYLSEFPNLSFHEGFFPDTARGVNELEQATYSMVHFDVDLYDSTLACLEFFYPRMTRGGIIISHDYSIIAGVRKAFDDFLADKPELAIELPTTQCMVVKL